MFVCIQIDPTKSFTATFFFFHLWLFETHSYVLGRDTKSGQNIGQRYLKAKNKPKCSNFLHVLDVSTIFLHITHKPGVISQK